MQKVMNVAVDLLSGFCCFRINTVNYEANFFATLYTASIDSTCTVLSMLLAIIIRDAVYNKIGNINLCEKSRKENINEKFSISSDMANPGTSNPDFDEPIDYYSKLVKGWHASPKEYDYWVPEADIEGTVPSDLRGTLLRNGPGLLEVYGSKLKHRKLIFLLLDSGLLNFIV